MKLFFVTLIFIIFNPVYPKISMYNEYKNIFILLRFELWSKINDVKLNVEFLCCTGCISSVDDHFWAVPIRLDSSGLLGKTVEMTG
jgi:hypothetical protein